MTTKKTIEECQNWKPREYFSDEEKIRMFDELRDMAIEWHENFFSSEGHEDSRSTILNRIAEEVLEGTLGEEVFQYTNPLC